MVNTSTIQEIELTELRRLTAFVQERFGYDFSNYAMSSFKRRITRILELERINSVDALIRKLEQNPDTVHDFISEVTVNVTEMFRDPSFWRVLRDKVIPNILLNHDKVSIWHAGCSSGEEVYSMAILLQEMGILDKAKIVATDMDKAILARAREGKYTIKNMELNEKNYIRFQGKGSLKDYYTVNGGVAQMDKSLVANISYREHDLTQGTLFSKFDLVLCRNVMIYFNQQLQNQVLHLLHESLFKYGYLIIGSKESLVWCEIANKFIVANNEEKIYKKVKD
ncbi:chemotaxis protein methyltransferase CheR [Catalinimonas alkaloidigena]|uniref:Chemotaxis protein methyltransferase CheR n=1 Tax=Catalinimonas alkaloidigena TaxID=1075417 RepID=A0A1G8Y1V2_9BACT|nr:protein-glutamate O-methyltransferase CheR [Catalinimonas alkaloidigena]SDJ96756.1 chemotaxis protein methyltransferase CheR [Catalinimonas alkaloidigena]